VKIYCIGGPADIGGANTELWHTVKLWRSFGVDVTILPQHGAEVTIAWRKRLDGIGCQLRAELPKGGVCVGFCNSHYRAIAKALRAQGNRLVYVPCMCYQFPDEAKRELFDHYIFQTHYQASRILPALEHRGLPQSHSSIIRGAFDVTEFDPSSRLRRRRQGEPFVIGRLSRSVAPVALGRGGTVPDVEKYPRGLWQQYEAIDYRPLRARVMGWSGIIQGRCGKPPAWAEVFRDGAMPAKEFLQSIHVLIPGIGCCEENWSRVGLEAMACGVPVVAEDKGGWREMTGVVRALTPGSQALFPSAWARDPETYEANRQRVRAAVEELCRPEPIWQAWLSIFERLEA